MVIVSAYYNLDLARKSPDSIKASRTTQTYLKYFSFWARVKNTFIIYTDEDIDEAIYEMRAKHGLKDKTIIIHKSLESFDPKALESIRKVFKEYDQSTNRFDKEHPPHTNPEYDYLMYLKSFFICDAIENPLCTPFIENEILWLDFGYNQYNNTFIDPAQFDFSFTPQAEYISLLTAQNARDKIILFALGPQDRRALPHILIHGTQSFITGCFFGANKRAFKNLKQCMIKALDAFVSFNIMDDDQKLYIWCVRNYPQYFHILYIDDWFHAIYYFMPEYKRKSISAKTNSILKDHTNWGKNIKESNMDKNPSHLKNILKRLAKKLNPS